VRTYLLSLLLMYALMCVGLGYAQETTDSQSESKIVALENLWNQAAQAKDLKALSVILDDGFIYVDRDGKVLTKADVLANIKASHDIQVSSESMYVYLHGSIAIVSGIYLTRGTHHGKPFIRRDRFLDTWSSRNGTWIVIASLTTPIAQ
jgi:ketosteroid isomerase-like protein